MEMLDAETQRIIDEMYKAYGKERLNADEILNWLDANGYDFYFD
ncbi:hypothetical protein [Brevibacillus laterosporus]|uniref:Uncharacterized protein n=1 Tax=Brevibacillus laterosporus LMG 15441 TaxID=1042163 RepID=A0A075RAK4_BRELA|nr:hypothetical protein [Brevibacillus laterosporus]AIG28426.1 hypothetical protein BRLA_c041510 [Brevibacillus laterosporus LMG 15441]